MIPYGFIELQFAKSMGINIDDSEQLLKYQLNEGGVVGLIPITAFTKMVDIIKNVYRAYGVPSNLGPVVCRSDVSGMAIVMHKYWYDDNIFDALTGAEIKSAPQYSNIRNAGIGSQRFVFGEFENCVRDYSTSPGSSESTSGGLAAPTQATVLITPRQPEAVAAEEAVEVQEARPAQTVKKEEENIAIPAPSIPETDEEKFLKKRMEVRDRILNKFDLFSLYRFPTSETDKKDKNQVYYNGNSDFDCNTISFLEEVQNNLSKKLEMDVYVIVSRNADLAIAKLMLDFTKEEIKEIKNHCLILVPNNSLTFLRSSPNDRSPKCFGKKVFDLGVVKGSEVNSQIVSIRSDANLDEEEKSERIKELINSAKTSPYSAFDAIYKDYVTETVWALKSGMVVYFTPYVRSGSNMGLYKTMVTELSRRIDGKLSRAELLEIDKNYNNRESEFLKKEYIDFYIDQSSGFIEEIKTKHEEEYQNYCQIRDQLLESASRLAMIQDQIKSIDEGRIKEKMAEEAVLSYANIIGIKKVKSVEIEEGRIHVYTKNIYAQDVRSGKWHDIGKFHIIISVNHARYNGRETVKIVNIKHSIKGMKEAMEAPHVFPEGYMCHGNAEIGMANAYSRKDFYQLVLQIILFLSEANTDDAAGQYVNKWPEVSESEAMSDEDSIVDKIKCEEKEFIKSDEELEGFLPSHIKKNGG